MKLAKEFLENKIKNILSTQSSLNSNKKPSSLKEGSWDFFSQETK